MNKTSFFRTIDTNFDNCINFTSSMIHIDNIVTATTTEKDPSILMVIDVNKDTHYIRAVDFYSRAEVVVERD